MDLHRQHGLQRMPSAESLSSWRSWETWRWWAGSHWPWQSRRRSRFSRNFNCGVQVTDARRRFPFHDYLRLRLATTFLAVLVICGIAAASGFPPQTTAVVLLIAGAKAMDAVSDVYFGSWQQRERMDAIARAQGISGLVALAVLAALVLWTHDLMWGACGIACGSAAGLGYVVLRQARRGRRGRRGDKRFRRRHAGRHPCLWRLAGLALPLAFAGGIALLQANFPRYCLSDMHGAAVAIYSVAYAPLAAVTLVCQALGAAITPRRRSITRQANCRHIGGWHSRSRPPRCSCCLACCGVLSDLRQGHVHPGLHQGICRRGSRRWW